MKQIIKKNKSAVRHCVYGGLTQRGRGAKYTGPVVVFSTCCDNGPGCCEWLSLASSEKEADEYVSETPGGFGFLWHTGAHSNNGKLDAKALAAIASWKAGFGIED
jgi:hypothetical protein